MSGQTFEYEGRQVPVRPGDTVAAALFRAGLTRQRITRLAEDRGLFCGIGLCHDCLVQIDGRAGQRACMVPAEGIARVMRHTDNHETGRDVPLARLAPLPEGGALPLDTADLAIIGGGPAGISAALAAGGRGLRVVLIDERKAAGGQYFKPVAAPHDPAALDAQHRAGGALRARLAASDVLHLTGTTIWHARAEGTIFELGLNGADRASLLHARAIVLATGAYERPAMIPGWTLPGVMTVGAAQTLIRSHLTPPGARIVIAGQGPLGLQLGAELCRLGTPPVAVLERARPTRAGTLPHVLTAARADVGLVAKGAGYRARLARAGVPVFEGWEARAIHPGPSGAASRLTAGRIGGPETRDFNADIICMGEGFLPQAELARALGCATRQDPQTGFLIPERDDLTGATSLPGVWIAGDGGGMGGAQVALAQGTLAGAAACAHLGAAPADVSAARAALARARRFQDALWRTYAAPPRADAPADAAMLCRCESVTFGAARAAIAQGAGDLGALKRLTRLGMGRCQGRYCSGPAALLTGTPTLFAPQTPARPVPAAAIALEKPEWGGHRQAPAPRLRAPERPQAQALPGSADLVIIGAGVMGTAAALRAAELGLETVVIDRGSVNGESSGGNAGSLHLQLLSFDFGQKTGGRGEALLQTLPLQRDAIALWQQLENDLDTSFEIKLTGGMMLAEEERHVAFLRDKIEAERRMGIEVDLIGRDEIAALAPGVSARMIAAAWCPGEGKINPLLGTPAIAGAARERGARFFEGVSITGLSGTAPGYDVTTSAGTIRARRLILAAGGWTGALGAMLGVALPVHGAPLQMVVTETAPPLASCLLAHCDRHLTMKQATAGNLIIGGAWSAAADPATGRTRILRESLEGNLWVAERVLPGMAGLHVLRSWAAMNVDIDGAPLLGQLPGHPDCVVVAGANGYTLGPLLGRLAAEIVSSGRQPAGLERFSPARLTAPA